MRLQAIQHECVSTTVKRIRERADQPVFEHPDASNTAFIEIIPVIHEILEIHLKRDVFQQAAQGALEGDLIRLLLKLVAREMDIMPTACRLTGEITQIQEIIGPNEYMDYAHRIAHAFQPLKLVQELHATRYFHQMLGFIDNDGSDAAPRDGVFQGMAQLLRVTELGRTTPGACLRFPGLPLIDVHDAILAVEGFPQLDQRGAVIVCSVERSPIRDSCFQESQG